jgi:hypothetical protein
MLPGGSPVPLGLLGVLLLCLSGFVPSALANRWDDTQIFIVDKDM